MHRNRDDDRSEYRRDLRHRDDRKEYKSSRRNRWDDRDRSTSTDRRGREESKSSRWDSRGRDSPSRYSRSRERRSRSRSPFSGRAGVNPSRDDYAQNQSSTRTEEATRDVHRKSSNWSDSSDEELSARRTYRPDDGSGQQRQVPSSASSTTIAKPISDEIPGKLPAGISLKLGGSAKAVAPLPKVISVPVTKKPTKIAAIFNTDDDDEEEEMPPECKMRMKNVGRETKTSEGPNSFGKTKIGFCNMSHLAEKELEGKMLNKKP